MKGYTQTQQAEIEARLKELLIRCRDDPELFNDRVLQRPPLHAVQKKWARAIVDYKVLAIETGNMLGKDWFFGGLIILWWLYTRPNALVVVTGPSQTVIGTVVWKELRRSVKNSPFFQSGLLKAKVTDGAKTSPQMIEVEPGWHALGFSTNTVERLSSQHGGNVLALMTEASGVEREGWEAIRGLGYIKFVAYGNPIRAICPFVDLCVQGEEDEKNGVPIHQAVKLINTPSTESPDADKEHSEVGLASKGWMDEMARIYGVDSPWYRSHVLAIRPTSETESIITPKNLDRCVSDEVRRAVAELRRKGFGGRKWISCDAGEGLGAAKTVIGYGDDLGPIEIHDSKFVDPKQAAQDMANLGFNRGVPARNMTFDAGGLTGRDMRRHLNALGLSAAVAYYGGGKGGRYAVNARTACAMNFAQRINPDIPLPNGAPQHPYAIPDFEGWAEMREELLALRRQDAGDDRKTALEPKEDMANRLGRSPDYADMMGQSRLYNAIKGP